MAKRTSVVVSAKRRERHERSHVTSITARAGSGSVSFLSPEHSAEVAIDTNDHVCLKPVLNWANVCSPNILRTVQRTMIRFLIELFVRRTWFGQFDELYFVLNWLVMRCKLRPELAAEAQQTA